MEQTYRFEPRIAHSLALQAAPDLAAPVDADPWRNAPVVGGLWDISRRGEPAEQATDLRICHTSSCLYVACQCRDRSAVAHDEVAEEHLPREQRGRRDWIELLVDGTHDHRHAVRIKLDVDGRLQAWRIHQGRGEMSNHVDASEEEVSDDAGLKGHARVGATGWEAALEVPFALIGLNGTDRDAVIGFDFERVRTSLPRRHWRWSPGTIPFSNTPLDYGDLYLAPPGPMVKAIDLGEVVYEGSSLCLTVVTEEGAGSLQLALTSRVVMPRDDERELILFNWNFRPAATAVTKSPRTTSGNSLTLPNTPPPADCRPCDSRHPSPAFHPSCSGSRRWPGIRFRGRSTRVGRSPSWARARRGSA